jgi:hypothetical protein
MRLLRERSYLAGKGADAAPITVGVMCKSAFEKTVRGGVCIQASNRGDPVTEVSSFGDVRITETTHVPFEQLLPYLWLSMAGSF